MPLPKLLLPLPLPLPLPPGAATATGLESRGRDARHCRTCRVQRGNEGWAAQGRARACIAERLQPRSRKWEPPPAGGDCLGQRDARQSEQAAPLRWLERHWVRAGAGTACN